MNKRQQLEAAIAESGKRLTEISQGDDLSKRTRKRILQRLGKLKKDLAAISGNSAMDTPSENIEQADFETNDTIPEVATPTQSKEERKLKLRLLNKDLAEFAQKKQLSLAKKRFEQGVRKGIKPDVHTFTNLVNAHVRCSDLFGAELVLERMKSHEISPNLVTYTTLLKGYSEMGDMHHACQVYFSCMTDGLVPNVRSLNTFLRACVRTGMVTPALQGYFNFISRKQSSNIGGRDDINVPSKKRKIDGPPGGTADEEYDCDASTYEYLVGLLCRAGRIESAEVVLRRFTEQATSAASNRAVSAGGVSTIENTAIYITLATMDTLWGGHYKARKWADLAADSLKRTENSELKESMMKRFQTGESAGSGGGKGKDEQDSRSVALFLRHRRTELEAQLMSVQDALAMSQSRMSTAGGGTAVLVAQLREMSNACTIYLQALSQVLYFGFDGCCDYDTLRLSGPAAKTFPEHDNRGTTAENEAQLLDIADRLLIALRDKFGLNACNLPELSTIAAPHLTQDLQVCALHKELQTSLIATRESVAEKLNRSRNSDSGYIDFQQLFTPLSEVSAPNDLAVLPVKLEICSGDGEWAVAQAAADWTSPIPGSSEAAPKALWVALELRCDRIQHTLAHYLISRPSGSLSYGNGSATSNSSIHSVHNLALLGGNAAKILPERIAPDSVAEVFVNHPQPPDRVAGGGDMAGKGKGGDKEKNQGAHLLTSDFFVEIMRILKVGGAITIVTDNQAYAKALAASIANMPVQRCGTSTATSVAYTAVLAGGVERKSLPADWEHTLDESHTVSALAPPSNGKIEITLVEEDVSVGRSVDVWRGEPGLEAGHVARASSYFDRMWDLGQKKRRWFLYVRKVEVHVQSLL